MVRFASAEQHEPRAGAAAAAASAGRQLTTAQSNLESTLLMRLQSNAHKNVCDERLSIVRQHGRFPKLAVVAILDDDLMSKSFAVEPAWRQALKSAGYYRTASGITATFLLSKQQRLRKYGLGAVCEATQLFNQIPGQEQMCDKMSVIKLLRAASHRLHLNLDEFMLPTILLAPPNRGGPSSSSNGAATDDDDDAFARFEQQLTSSSSNNGDEGVAWVHKRLGVENSQGVTPYSWRGLREKRQALGPAGFSAGTCNSSGTSLPPHKR